MQKERKRTVRGRLQRECCKGEPQTECDRHTRLVLITYYRSRTVKVKKRAQKRAREKTKQLFPLFSLQHLHLSSSYEVLLTLVVAFCCSSNPCGQCYSLQVPRKYYVPMKRMCMNFSSHFSRQLFISEIINIDPHHFLFDPYGGQRTSFFFLMFFKHSAWSKNYQYK